MPSTRSPAASWHCTAPSLEDADATPVGEDEEEDVVVVVVAVFGVVLGGVLALTAPSAGVGSCMEEKREQHPAVTP